QSAVPFLARLGRQVVVLLGFATVLLAGAPLSGLIAFRRPRVNMVATTAQQAVHQQCKRGGDGGKLWHTFDCRPAGAASQCGSQGFLWRRRFVLALHAW